MNILTTIGSATACCGVLFFLICAGLVFWYLFNQPKQAVSATAPEPAVSATVAHPTAASGNDSDDTGANG
jgi:hypothetical protein